MVESVGRIFVAVGFPPEVRMAMAGGLNGVEIPGAVVPVENLHLTFRFVGDIDPVSFDRLLAALAESTLPAPFRIRLGGLGAFPKARKASVLWLDASDPAGGLDQAHSAVEESCETAGLGREERPFRPHVTLSRIRPPVDVRSLIDSTPALGLSSPVDELVVLRSHLGGAGTRYEPVERFPLR